MSTVVSPIILIVFIVILVFYYYIFVANPYRVLNIARIPLMISCLVIVFCVLIFIEYYASNPVYQSDSSSEVWSNFIKYSYKYFYFLFYFLVLSIIGYGIFKSIESSLVYSFQYSFWVTVGLIFLILALFSKTQSQKTPSFDSSYFDLIKTLIMYIPCLITDSIEYMKKDYENTPSTVFIVFVMILIYLLFFYLIPLFRKQQYTNDGVTLVGKAAYLNTNILSITSNELKEKIMNQRPFYDRWFQKIMAEQSEPKVAPKKVKVDMEEPVQKGSSFFVPPDSLTLPYYLSKKEGFTSLQVQDAQMIPFDQIKYRIEKILEIPEEDIDPFKEKYVMKEFLVAHPQFLTVYEKIQYMKSAAFASWDTITSIPSVLAGDTNKITKYNYHYAITAWIYLQEVQSKEIQHIYSFGTRPSIYYIPSESSLMIVSNYNNQKQKILYKTDKILFQRWNFIVMNYKYGTLDLFINNNLVGTYPNVLSVLNTEDVLLVGSNQNSPIGGICNMKFYELPLGIRKIDTIYKSFHNKKIPI